MFGLSVHRIFVEIQYIYIVIFFSKWQVFEGNNVDNKTINHELSPSLLTRFVRLHAMEWHQLICIRVELTGCKGMLTRVFLREKKLCTY